MWFQKEKPNFWFENYKILKEKHEEALRTILHRGHVISQIQNQRKQLIKQSQESKRDIQEYAMETQRLTKELKDLTIAFRLVMSQLPNVKVINGEQIIYIKKGE